MPRNCDSLQTSSEEMVAINQVGFGTVGRQWPGIEPPRISEERGLAWIHNIRFASEQVLWVAISRGTVRIEIAVESVTSLVGVGSRFAPRKPSPGRPSVGRLVFLQLRRGTLRCRRTDPYFVDGRISTLESEHPEIRPVVVVHRLAFVGEIHPVGQPKLFQVVDAGDGLRLAPGPT